VLFGLKGGVLLGKSTDLGRQSGIVGTSLKERAPKRLEVAARRFARALCNT
jgi:hypothetical protein